MLTVARNIALGLGMTSAEGRIPTNGSQPLCTFLWSFLFRLAHGDKILKIALIHFLQLIMTALTAWLSWRLGRRVLAALPQAETVAALAAAAWFASRLTVQHTQNCLETAAYGLVVLVFVLCFWGVLTRRTSAGRRSAPPLSDSSWGSPSGFATTRSFSYWRPASRAFCWACDRIPARGLRSSPQRRAPALHHRLAHRRRQDRVHHRLSLLGGPG